MNENEGGFAAGYAKRDKEIRRHLEHAMLWLVPKIVRTIMLAVDAEVLQERRNKAAGERVTSESNPPT